MLPAWTTGGKNNQRSGEINPLGFCVVAEVLSESPDAIKAHFSPLPLHKVSEDFSMSERQAEYVTEAMELLKGTSVEIQPARTALVRENGEFREVEKPAFIKLSTAFKGELPSMSGDALKVWIFICLSINRKSERANPGLRTIAAGTGMGVNTVQSALKDLEGMNLLKVDRQSRKYNIYEAPEYVSANRQEPVSGLDTDGKTVSESPESVSENSQTVSGVREDFLLNQSNQKNQNMPTPRIDRTDAEQAELDERKMVAMVSAAQEGGKKQNPLITFEGVFAFGKLPWDTNSTWEKFAKFVRQVHEADPTAFGRYISWRGGDGKYSAFSNRKIRENPQAFMDTGWPEFVASEKPKSNFEKSEITYDKHGLPESW